MVAATSSSQGTRRMKVACGVLSSTMAPTVPPRRPGQSHGNGEAHVLADVFAVGGDGGELAGPEGDGVGGVGLDGQHLHAQHGGKEQERAASGDRVEQTGEKGCDGEQAQRQSISWNWGRPEATIICVLL